MRVLPILRNCFVMLESMPIIDSITFEYDWIFWNISHSKIYLAKCANNYRIKVLYWHSFVMLRIFRTQNQYRIIHIVQLFVDFPFILQQIFPCSSHQSNHIYSSINNMAYLLETRDLSIGGVVSAFISFPNRMTTLFSSPFPMFRFVNVARSAVVNT